MEFWDFKQNEAGQWAWCCLSGGGVARHAGGFRSRNDCIADAMRNGYLRDPTAPAGYSPRENGGLPNGTDSVPFFPPPLLVPRD